MNFELKSGSLTDCALQALDGLILLQNNKAAATTGVLGTVVNAMQTAGDLGKKAGKVLAMYRPAGVAARRLIVASVGEGSPREVRQAVTAGINSFKTSATVKKIGVCFAGELTPGAVRAAIAGIAEASYVYTATKSKAEARHLILVTLILDDAKSHQVEFDRAVAQVAGVELAMEWGNRPANHATPEHLAQVAKTLAKSRKISCDVLGPKQIAKLKMGSFMAVAQGARTEARFIVLNYAGAVKTLAPVVLVGKGITFDTGGISIKPAPEMDEMKFDMCGAASVLGVFQSLARLQPHINVVGLIPSCENMPDGNALKPGDVVTSMSGQTIEVLNTDAEGRLILCDALTYAERFKPAAVVDIATLTGACVIALGGVRSGLFSTNDALAQQLHRAGEAALDPCWRMPLDDDYADALKSNFADVANVGGRAGGSITAAKFLQRFAGQFAWAHLDIAGTAWKSGAAKGSTGRPVPLLLEFLLGFEPVSPKPVGSPAARAAPKAAPRKRSKTKTS